MQLHLTRTEGLIVEALKKKPLTKFQLEEVIDREKIFSEKYIAKIVNWINKQRQIITIPSKWDWFHYELTENNIEVRIVQGLEELKKMTCNTCVHKAQHKETYILAWVSFIVGFLFAFFISWLIIDTEVTAEVEVILDCEDIYK